jgi:tRNA(fMet)-specific endonuclease VapC
LVWHELRFGCARLAPSRRRDVLERYLDEMVGVSLPVLGYGRRAADWHALERARLVAAGRTPHFVDGHIAAIARVNDLTLVTMNKAAFQDFKALQVRSWD